MQKYSFFKVLACLVFFIGFSSASYGQGYEGDDYTPNTPTDQDCISCVSTSEIGNEVIIPNDDDDDWDDWDDDWGWDDFYDFITDNDAPIDDEWFFNSEPPDGYDYGTPCEDPIECPTMKTFTIAGPNRERKTVAVGEPVGVHILGLCGKTTVTWRVEGAVLIKEGKINCEVQAPFRKGSFRIYATIHYTQNALINKCGVGGATSELVEEFEVIEPQGVSFVKRSSGFSGCAAEFHRVNRPSAGMFADMYIYPPSVNFYKLTFKEHEAKPEKEGAYFLDNPFPVGNHLESPPFSATSYVNPIYGTKIDGVDTQWQRLQCRNDWPVNLEGTVLYNIGQFYLVEDYPVPDSYKKYSNAEQSGTNDPSVNPANPIFTVKKVGIKSSSAVSVPLLNPTIPCSTWINIPPCN